MELLFWWLTKPKQIPLARRLWSPIRSHLPQNLRLAKKVADFISITLSCHPKPPSNPNETLAHDIQKTYSNPRQTGQIWNWLLHEWHKSSHITAQSNNWFDLYFMEHYSCSAKQIDSIPFGFLCLDLASINWRIGCTGLTLRRLTKPLLSPDIKLALLHLWSPVHLCLTFRYP